MTQPVSCTLAVNKQPTETSLTDLALLFSFETITDFLVRVYTGPDEVTELSPKDCEPDAIGGMLTGRLDGGPIELVTRNGIQSWPAGAVQAVHAYIATDGVL